MHDKASYSHESILLPIGLYSGRKQLLPDVHSLMHLTFAFLTLIINISNTYAQDNADPGLKILQGIASGDVTENSAVIWSRVNLPSLMHVEFSNNSLFSYADSRVKSVDNATDFTGMIKLGNLTGATQYFYRVWFSSTDNRFNSSSMTGTFKTAPLTTTESETPISFIISADLGGQTYCREDSKDGGYRIFEKMKSLSPDFYIQNGDMIYADNKCPKLRLDGDSNIPGNFSSNADPDVNWNNVSLLHEIYLKHWEYNRDDPNLQAFLSNTSMYGQWDDHEVINDFGGQWSYWNEDNKNRTGYPNLVKEGRDVFFNFMPIERSPEHPNKIYRLFHWGKEMDLFLLDARSNRSRNDIADTVDNNKTMLGKYQLTWLKQNLLNSTATWKVISSNVPMSVPTGSNASKYGRDGWANGIDLDFSSKTGFERELKELLKFIDDNEIRNVVFVTTDVHFPAILKYNTDTNGDGDSVDIYEIISGPLSAFRFGIPGISLPMLDPTFQPTILYVEGGVSNYAYIQIKKQPDGNTHLIASIIGEDGVIRPNSSVDIVPTLEGN